MLSDSLPSSDAKIGAKQLVAVLSDVVPGDRLDVVFDRQYKRLDVARTDAELRELVITMRPLTVIPLAERLADVTDAFRRLVELTGASTRAKPAVPRKAVGGRRRPGPTATSSPDGDGA